MLCVPPGRAIEANMQVSASGVRCCLSARPSLQLRFMLQPVRSCAVRNSV